MNSIFIQRNIPYSLRKMIEHETNAPNHLEVTTK